MALRMKQPENDRFFVFAAAPMLANRLQVVGDSVTEDLTFKQWLVLLIVRDMPDGSSLTEIAEQHGSSRQNVKKLLDGLAKLGYVRLAGDKSDKRSSAVFMTKAGKARMTQISEVGESFVDTVFEGTDSHDVAAARRVIMRMLTNLDSFSQNEG